MRKVLTMKRPIFLGATAQAIGAKATIGQRHGREATARSAVAKAFEGKEVILVKNGSRLCVFTDPQIPQGLDLTAEGQARIEWAGEDGTIILTVLEN